MKSRQYFFYTIAHSFKLRSTSDGKSKSKRNTHLVCFINTNECFTQFTQINTINLHCVKNVCIRSYSGRYFLAFGPE